MDISCLIIHPSPSAVPLDTPSTVLLQPSLPNVSPSPSESPPTVAFLPSGVNSVLVVSSPLPPAQPAPPNAQPEKPVGPLTIIPLSTPSLSTAPTLSKQAFVDTGGATCFAERNPLKDVQPSRFRVRTSQSDAVKLGQAERKAARSQKADELKDGVDAIVKSRDDRIKDLSERLSVTEKVIRTLVNGETHYKKHRQPNVFNALVHRATDEMNTGNVAATVISRKADKHSPPRPWPW